MQTKSCLLTAGVVGYDDAIVMIGSLPTHVAPHKQGSLDSHYLEYSRKTMSLEESQELSWCMDEKGDWEMLECGGIQCFCVFAAAAASGYFV